VNKLSGFFRNVRLYLVLIWNLTIGIFGKDYSCLLGAFYGVGSVLAKDGNVLLDYRQNNAKSMADKYILHCGIAIHNAIRHLIALIIILARSNRPTQDTELIIRATRIWECELEESVLMANELEDMMK